MNAVLKQLEGFLTVWKAIMIPPIDIYIYMGREWWWYHLSFLLSSNGNRAWRIIIPKHFPGFSFIIATRARESTRAVELLRNHLALTPVDYIQQIDLHCIAVNGLM
jgi:hypothetical protein